MYKDIDGHSTDWIEWVEQPHCIACAKSEYVLPFTDHYKRLEQTQQLLSLAIQTWTNLIYNLCVLDTLCNTYA